MCPTNFCSVQPVATPGRVLSALPKCRHPSTHKNAACIDQYMQDYCFIKHPVTVSERAPRGVAGPRRAGPASAAVRAEPRARRYVGMIVRIRRSRLRSRCGSRAGERRASPVNRRTSLSHELQRPCGPKRQSLSHETPRTCQYWQYKASPSRRRDVRSSYTAPRAYADPPAR